MTLLLQTLVFGVVQGSTTALLGVGLVAVHRATRVVNFAHGAMATVATYIFATLVDHGSRGLVAVVVAAAAGAALGLLVDLLVMRPLAARPALTRTVATLGVLYALQGLVLTLWGGTGRSVPPLFPSGGLIIAGLAVSWAQVGVVASALALTLVLGAASVRSRLGTSMRAVADDPEAAEISGIRVEAVRAAGWALGGATGAVAGVLLAPSLGLDSYTLTLLVIAGLSAAMTGRLDSLPLALAGGLGIGVATELVRTYAQRWFGAGPSWINLAGVGDAVALLWLIGLLLMWAARGTSGLGQEPESSPSQGGGSARPLGART